MYKEGMRCERMCPKNLTVTSAAAAEKPTFDCVPCNKSFPKIHFIIVLSICLPPRLLSSLCSLIVIPYPYSYPYPNRYPNRYPGI